MSVLYHRKRAALAAQALAGALRGRFRQQPDVRRGVVVGGRVMVGGQSYAFANTIGAAEGARVNVENAGRLAAARYVPAGDGEES